MRSIGTRARSATPRATLTSRAHVAQRVAQLRQRDHLHVLAARRLVGGDEVDVGRRHPQRVQHPGLGRDDRPSSPGPRAPARSSSMPPVESMCTPSGSTSPAATYSMTDVEQPHSGWIRKSAPGCAARIVADVVGRMPACTWHSPSQTCILLAGALLDVGAEEHVRPEQDLGVLAVLAEDVLDDLDRVRGRHAVVGLGLDLGRRVDVHDDDRAGVLGLPVAQLLGGDRVGERAAGVEVGDQHASCRGTGSRRSRP